MVQFLSSRGADRTNAEEVANEADQQHVIQWLIRSRSWYTELHHLSIISHDRACLLLRGGANLEDGDEGATIVDIAKTLLDEANTERSAAVAVVMASKPWSPLTHCLFPLAARQRARNLLYLGATLVKKREATQGFLECWISYVLP